MTFDWNSVAFAQRPSRAWHAALEAFFESAHPRPLHDDRPTRHREPARLAVAVPVAGARIHGGPPLRVLPPQELRHLILEEIRQPSLDPEPRELLERRPLRPLLPLPPCLPSYSSALLPHGRCLLHSTSKRIVYTDEPMKIGRRVGREILPGHGGARAGAGRPPTGNRPITLRLLPHLLAAVRRDARRAEQTLSQFVAAKLRRHG
jgi:hypothetical protein